MNKLVVSLLVVSMISISFGLDCSHLIVKESEGFLNWLGNITFEVPISTGESGWRLTLLFDQNFTGVGVWDGYLKYNGTGKWAKILKGENNAEQEAGEILSLRFRVYYGMDIPQPRVVSLGFQDISYINNFDFFIIELCD